MATGWRPERGQLCNNGAVRNRDKTKTCKIGIQACRLHDPGSYLVRAHFETVRPCGDRFVMHKWQIRQQQPSGGFGIGWAYLTLAILVVLYLAAKGWGSVLVAAAVALPAMAFAMVFIGGLATGYAQAGRNRDLRLKHVSHDSRTRT